MDGLHVLVFVGKTEKSIRNACKIIVLSCDFLLISSELPISFLSSCLVRCREEVIYEIVFNV